MGFENAVRRTGFAARMFAYLLATYSLIIKRQNKQLHSLKKELKKISAIERARVAQLIDEGAPHKSIDCNDECDAHIIVQFIRELKD